MTMKIKFHFGNKPVDDKLGQDKTVANYDKINSQSVSFFYLTTKDDGICERENNIPRKIDLPEQDEQEFLSDNTDYLPVFMNFKFKKTTVDGTEHNTKYPGVGISLSPYSAINYVSIYRREVYLNPYNKLCYYNSSWDPVVTAEDKVDHKFFIRDYNIANNRNYQYAVYITNKQYSDMKNVEYEGDYSFIKTNWSGWSITELTPTLDKNVYNAHPKDVWRFKYNVSTGQQTQNISKKQQETLSNYSRVSNGMSNSISGSVSCLLGKDVVPANYSSEYEITKEIKKPTISASDFSPTGKTENIGSYVQELGRFEDGCGAGYISPNQIGFYDVSSNPRIDMIEAWKNVCYSGNPKLLKDPSGQSFIVQITSSSMQINDDIYHSPCTISFDWIQVGSTDGIVINELTSKEYSKENGV